VQQVDQAKADKQIEIGGSQIDPAADLRRMADPLVEPGDGGGVHDPSLRDGGGHIAALPPELAAIAASISIWRGSGVAWP